MSQLLTRKNGQRRVVITGIGAISPLGLTLDETWKNALNGVSGIDNITKFDASSFDVRFAGEVKNFNPDLYVEKKNKRKWIYSFNMQLPVQKWRLNNLDYFRMV